MSCHVNSNMTYDEAECYVENVMKNINRMAYEDRIQDTDAYTVALLRAHLRAILAYGPVKDFK